MTKNRTMISSASDGKSKGIVVLGSRTKLIVENIKCGGCAKTISKALIDIGYKNINVTPEESSVEIDSPKDSSALTLAIKRLSDLGYPLIETEDGLKAVALKARSYISCALGKFG